MGRLSVPDASSRVEWPWPWLGSVSSPGRLPARGRWQGWSSCLYCLSAVSSYARDMLWSAWSCPDSPGIPLLPTHSKKRQGTSLTGSNHKDGNDTTSGAATCHLAWPYSRSYQWVV